jgi:hypothetical protein
MNETYFEKKCVIKPFFPQEIDQIDSHWRPQWTFCPYCSLDFDLIGRLEDFQSEFEFLVKKLGLKVSLSIFYEVMSFFITKNTLII